jgi:hypothetical protein
MCRRTTLTDQEQMTFAWHEPDRGVLTIAARDFLQQLETDKTTTHFLIACSKRKQPVETIAAELYDSTLFKLSTTLANRLGIRFSILSAKHGLIEPERLVKPYDVTLASLKRNERSAWAENVLNQIIGRFVDINRLVVLAGERYRVEIVPTLLGRGLEILEPLQGLSLGWRISFLKHCHRLLDREDGVRRLYRQFENLALKHGLYSLAEALRHPLPQQGVYFFFDPDETTPFSHRLPRIVRIGTHGVSLGSKATLRTRLRTHFGTSDGNGNHRSSVFRLHIGEALIHKLGLAEQFPNWGRGQNVAKSTIESERELEREVSRYIAKLQVLSIEVMDDSTRFSARSTIEKNALALFTEDLVPLDPPSKDWLGLCSSQAAIKQSGLWNVREVGTTADLKIICTISDYIDRQISASPAPQN